MGRAPCCDKANVKKGPWSPEEDGKLKEYIEKHGTGGNWIALPQKAGLRRCGKSCRLRWLNYLRPNIKHGDFSDEEDRIICNLFANIGSRWSIIAAQLPGRTDNDIKNYWNTKLKKKIMALVPSQRNPAPFPFPQTFASSIFKDLDGNNFSSFSKSLFGHDPISHASLTNPSFLFQNQESLITSMHKDSHILAFGSEATSSSNSDGSCSQLSYGRSDFKQEDMMLYGYSDDAQHKFFLSYGGNNPYNGGVGETLMDFQYQDVKQLISSNNSDQYSSFVFDKSKMQDKSMYFNFY